MYHNRVGKPINSEGRNGLGKIVGRRYRFVDDYKKQVYVGANGKSKERISYIGQWVWPLNEQSEYARIVLFSRIAAGVLLAAAAASLVIVPLPLENRWYLPITAIAFFPLLYVIMGVIKMPTKARPMERQRFANSFERARGAAVVCLVFLGLALITWAVCWILVRCKVMAGTAFSVRDGAYALCLLLAGAAGFAIVRKTKEIKTELRDNASYKPE